MEKIKIVFYSFDEKETVIIDEDKYFNRLTGEGEFKNVGITLWNSQTVEVFRKNFYDKRKWYLSHRYTNEKYSYLPL